jgi:hypothetical protein
MRAIDYRRKALELLDEYLAGKTSREAVWQWAQEVIISKEWGQAPPDLQDAIHGIWLLHDAEGSWVPNTEELQKIRDALAE